MVTDNVPKHISQQFDNELEQVRSRVLAMGGLAEQQLQKAIKSLLKSDIKLAEEIIEQESQVNFYDVSIDSECTGILARRQPAATDLRLVMAISKTLTDIERIGDETEKIAQMVIRLAGRQAPKSYYVGVDAMGDHVGAMLRDTLDAFARMDSRAAVEIANEEPKADLQYGAILRQLVTYMMEDPRNISDTFDTVWVARSLERIGDHVRNICEHIIYLVEGKDVRHLSLEQIEKAVSPPEDQDQSQ